MSIGLVQFLIYVLQVNCSSRKTPKYCIAWFLLFPIMGWLFIFTYVGFVYQLGDIKMKIFSSFLVRFNLSFHFVNQSEIQSSKFCKSMIEFSRYLLCIMIAISSVYITNCHFCGFVISWQNMLNSVSPRTDPWRTPAFIRCIWDVSMSIRTRKERFVINEHIIL